MAKKILIPIFVTATALLLSCSGNNRRGMSDSPTDSLASKDYVLAESLLGKGEIDSALTVIDRCIDCEGITDSTRADALVMKTNILYGLGNNADVITSAQEAVKACRKLGGEYSYFACDVESKAANVLIGLGKKDEAFATVDRCLSELRSSHDFYALQTWLNCMKRKATLLINTDSISPVPGLCGDALARLGELDSGKKKYALPQYYIDHPDEIHDMADFYRGQFLAYKADVLSSMGRNKEASVCVDECLKTSWAQMPNASALLIGSYQRLGMYDRLSVALNTLKEVHKDDTISDNRCRMLIAEAALYGSKGDYKKQVATLDHLAHVMQEVRKQENRDQLATLATVYKLNEKEDARLRSEAKAAIFALVAFIAVVIVAMLCVWIMVRRRKYREMVDAYKAIQEKYTVNNDGTFNSQHSAFNSQDPAFNSQHSTSNIQLPTFSSQQLAVNSGNEETASRTAVPTGYDAVLIYAKVMQMMRDEKLYKDSDMNLEMLTGRIGSNRTYVSRAINEMSGTSFKMWLAAYRNKVIIDALRRNPELSIDELCLVSGYASRNTFSRQFKQINGLTITEYRKMSGQ